MKLLNELDVAEVMDIQELDEADVYDISNYEIDCFENEGNFFCEDALVHNCIPLYIKNRDDKLQKWKNGLDLRIYDILKDTHGVLYLQEQLTSLWIRLAGFTVPEAETARKIMSKKWKEKLPWVEKKWKEGAVKTIGEKEADRLWELQLTFGRYAFNAAHAVAYSILTYRCLYLKAHYPAQWWAAVLCGCHQDKVVKYMRSARLDGVKFATIDINNLSEKYAVNEKGEVIPGLSSIKGMNKEISQKLCAAKQKFNNITEVVEIAGRQRNVYERLIQLGAFDKIYPNRNALWIWYQYLYCPGKIRNEIYAKFYTSEKLEHIRKVIGACRKIPKNWKPALTIEKVMSICKEYSDLDKLRIEKTYLGYYITSPLTLHTHDNNNTIENAKKDKSVIDVVIENIEHRRSIKHGRAYTILIVSDRFYNIAEIFLFDEFKDLEEGAVIRISVNYDKVRDSFRGTGIKKLRYRYKDEEEMLVIDNSGPTEQKFQEIPDEELEEFDKSDVAQIDPDSPIDLDSDADDW